MTAQDKEKRQNENHQREMKENSWAHVNHIIWMLWMLLFLVFLFGKYTVSNGIHSFDSIQWQSIFIATLFSYWIRSIYTYHGFPFNVNRLIVFDSIDLLSISYARISLFLFIAVWSQSRPMTTVDFFYQYLIFNSIFIFCICWCAFFFASRYYLFRLWCIAHFPIKLSWCWSKCIETELITNYN